MICWWRRGDSNSGPRPIPGEHLQAQSPVGVSVRTTSVDPRVLTQQGLVPSPHTCVSGSGSPLHDVGSGSGDSCRAASLLIKQRVRSYCWRLSVFPPVLRGEGTSACFSRRTYRVETSRPHARGDADTTVNVHRSKDRRASEYTGRVARVPWDTPSETRASVETRRAAPPGRSTSPSSWISSQEPGR